MAIPIGSLKPAMTIRYNDELYMIIASEHARLGRGSAFCRVKLRNVRNSQVIECTLRDSDNVEEVDIDKRKLQYLYAKGEEYHFLDLDSYEDLAVPQERIGDKAQFMIPDLELIGLYYEHEFIDLELPSSVELTVTETSPSVRGDTVKMVTKPATLETGLVIDVPLFVVTGDKVRVDTRTKGYAGRA